MAGVTEAVLVGFGTHAARYTIPRYLSDKTAHDLAFTAVTGLRYEHDEYQSTIVPYFQSMSLPPPRYHNDLDDALSDTNPSATTISVIGTPNRLHAEQIRNSLDAGLHVFVERPLVTHHDDLDELVDLANQKRLLLYTGIQRRTEREYVLIREIISDSARFGRLASIRCTLRVGRRPLNWRTDQRLSGGGIVIDSGYHLLDCAAWIAADFGSAAPTNVAAHFASDGSVLGADTPAHLETTAVGVAMLDGDILTTFDLTYASPHKSVHERIEFCDTEGTRITLTRTEEINTGRPGVIAYQKYDGSTVLIGEEETPGATGTPLVRFVRACHTDPDLLDKSDPCAATGSIPTWRLIRGIYRNAKWA